MKRVLGLALGAGLLLPAVWAQAAAPVNVHVSLGKVSEVDFPEKVAKVIKGGLSDSVLVEVLDNVVYVMPKTNSPAGIFVTGVSGESYPLNLLVAADHDIKVQIDPSSVKKISQEVMQDALALMKKILLNQEPPGATVIKGGRTIALGGQNIKFTVETIYDFPHIAAYVFEARNLAKEEAAVPVEQVTFPHVLAVACDEELLRPSGQPGDATRLYLVAGK